MNSSEKSLVETLARSKIYQDYQTAFREAVGLPLSFTPAETWGLPLHDDRKENPFCRLMAQTSKSCAACLEIQGKLSRDSTAASGTATCAFGLSDSVVPVKLGERLIGYLRTGQVFTQAPTERDFENAVATLAGWGVHVNRAELRTAYFGTRIMTPAQYQAVLRLLEVFAIQLGVVCNQILVAEETEENPQVSRAKEFITANLAEDLGLADCARASHMSTFYFCKMFKRATGLTFTDYVARLRTEKAKSLLLDTHARVSEVAFEVGFQSLSQFNRVFRRITGQSPTDYRQQLASSLHPTPSQASPESRRYRFGVAGRISQPATPTREARLTLAAG